jgi:hypothetical protein
MHDLGIVCVTDKVAFVTNTDPQGHATYKATDPGSDKASAMKCA